MKNTPLIIYQTEDGTIKIETHFENETVWLNQAQIGGLFQKSKATISEHIKNIYSIDFLNKLATFNLSSKGDFANSSFASDI
jgi:hypothetical protein